MTAGGIEKFGAQPRGREEEIPKIPEVEAFRAAVINGGGMCTNTYVMKNGFIPFRELSATMGGYGEKLLNCLPGGVQQKKVDDIIGCTPGDFVNAAAHVQNITADEIHFKFKFWGGNFEWWAITDTKKGEDAAAPSSSEER